MAHFYRKIILCIYIGLLFVYPLTATAVTYTYDQLNRLTRVDYGEGAYIEYTYDSAGNITSVSVSPAEGQGDSDEDGLDDDTEEALGTDPNKADTDNDGLSDGDEVNLYHTNPLKTDSDGDGYSDREELVAESDPNNPLDMPSSLKALPAILHLLLGDE